MRLQSSLSFALLLFLTPSLVFAQRPGGGGGNGAGQQGQQRPQSTGGAGQRQGVGQGTMDRVRQQDRDRLHAQLTTQQRDQYRDCTQTMDRLHRQTRDLTRTSGGSAFSAEEARRQQSQIREQFRNLEQTRTQLAQGLTKDQRTAVQQRIQTMDRLRDRIESRLASMDKELSGPAPDNRRFAEQARLSSREMKAWRDQFRHMGDDLGMTAD